MIYIESSADLSLDYEVYKITDNIYLHFWASWEDSAGDLDVICFRCTDDMDWTNDSADAIAYMKENYLPELG